MPQATVKQGGATTEIDDKSLNFNELLYDVGQNKNKDSFIALFEHFAPRIKSFLMRGGVTIEQADELAQETMLTIWNRAESYNPAQAAASTWIFTIARNKKIDEFRKIKRYRIDPLEPETVESYNDIPLDELDKAQKEDKIKLAVETLPDEQRKLLEMSFFDDKSHGEIAEETGLPLGTVKSRIRLALERLRGNKDIKKLEI